MKINFKKHIVANFQARRLEPFADSEDKIKYLLAY
jgi:hypothetical protein